MKAEETLEAYKKRLEEIKQEFIEKYKTETPPIQKGNWVARDNDTCVYVTDDRENFYFSGYGINLNGVWTISKNWSKKDYTRILSPEEVFVRVSNFAINKKGLRIGIRIHKFNNHEDVISNYIYTTFLHGVNSGEFWVGGQLSGIPLMCDGKWVDIIPSNAKPKPGDYVRAWVGVVVNVKTQSFGKVECIDGEGQYVLQDGQKFPYAKVISKEDFERVNSI